MSGAGERRLVAAMLASTVAGAVIYWLVIVRGLPMVVHGLTDAQVLALRDGLRTHPVRIAAGVLAAAAVLALPVLLVFRLVYGPFTGSRRASER